MKTDDIMAAVPVYFSGTGAAADTVREAWSVAAVMLRRVAIQVLEAMGAGAFRLRPESARRAEVLPAAQVFLAGQQAEVVLAAVPALMVVAGSEDKEKTSG